MARKPKIRGKKYLAAYDAWLIAAKKWGQVQKDYRAQKIGDDAYLKGRKEFEKAQDVLDRAEREDDKRPRKEPRRLKKGVKISFKTKTGKRVSFKVKKKTHSQGSIFGLF